mmetsp:Transcript_24549/g.58353  ORF Transcript_24549/g.58353 Transcript_24549/m.58353 type:complete len:344 (-) Transcript_24549:77-1108(-)
MSHQPGSVFGAVGLVAGTTVGAGILALPATTAPAGFAASAVALTGGAVYAMVTALLLAEVNLNTLCELGGGGVSIVSMAERTLGKGGTRLASGAYLFLHYCLLVAYFSRGGEALQGLAGVPLWLGSAAFAGALGGMCYFSSTKALDAINGVLFAGVLLSFGVLTAGGVADVDPQSLGEANWGAVPATLPVISLAFVFQNIVPVIVSNLEGDIGKASAGRAARSPIGALTPPSPASVHQQPYNPQRPVPFHLDPGTRTCSRPSPSPQIRPPSSPPRWGRVSLGNKGTQLGSPSRSPLASSGTSGFGFRTAPLGTGQAGRRGIVWAALRRLGRRGMVCDAGTGGK